MSLSHSTRTCYESAPPPVSDIVLNTVSDAAAADKKTPAKPLTLDDIFDRCIVTPSGCWIWTGADSGDGRGGNYGKICQRVNGKPRFYYAHRKAFELSRGKSVAKGFQVDHLCARFLGHDGWNARRCCNPDHLEDVIGDQNQKRKFIVSEIIQPKLETLRPPVDPFVEWEEFR
jgi:hypothetical protein